MVDQDERHQDTQVADEPEPISESGITSEDIPLADDIKKGDRSLGKKFGFLENLIKK